MFTLKEEKVTGKRQNFSPRFSPLRCHFKTSTRLCSKFIQVDLPESGMWRRDSVTPTRALLRGYIGTRDFFFSVRDPNRTRLDDEVDLLTGTRSSKSWSSSER